MPQWSEEAANELESYLSGERKALAKLDVDADEVLEDLRAHVDEEIKGRRLQVVTRRDLAEILRRIGPLTRREDGKAANVDAPDASKTQFKTATGAALAVFGVLLPTISIVVELCMRACARAFFDPMPTWWHVLLISSVPAANALVIFQIRRGSRCCPQLLMAANAVAITVAAFYAVGFVPLLLPGVVAILFFGFGLLPMGPLFALVAAICCRCRLASFLGKSRRTAGAQLLGYAAAVAFLGALEFPNIAARIGLELADSQDPAVQTKGVRLLRSFGSEATMIRACYERPRKFTNLAAFLISPENPVRQQEARMIFFRVTGKPFNSVPPPRLYHSAGRWNALDELAWDLDEGLGGSTVAGRVRGLDLASSRLDGRIHGQAGLAYLEWTFEFANHSSRQREARAQILLPTDGVISRLTLWVNGEEREAAFASRTQTRAAYQEVAVRQRRDPVLVTASGPNRILMQCFPIPPDGGAMKVRLGITAPLAMSDPRNGRIPLPKIIERNFRLQPDLQHALWIESGSKLSSPLENLKSGVIREQSVNEETSNEISTLRGQLADVDLLSNRAALRVRLPEASIRVRTAGLNPNGSQSAEKTRNKASIILQELTSGSPLDLDRLAIVIDGSDGMSPFYPEIARSLAQLPPSIELFLIHASNEQTADKNARNSADETISKDAAAKVRSLQAVGGQDNLEGLVRAWDIASAGKNSAILWIHGPQPVNLSSDAALRQRLERSPAHPQLFAIQTAAGPNRLLEQLGAGAIQSLTRWNSLENDLADWFRQLSAKTGPWRFQRRAVSLDAIPDFDKVPEVTDHVRRLYVADQIESLASTGDRKKAVQMAGQHQLVTSVSGAVVLETKEQFDRAGLSPVDPAEVPVIPEPTIWLLLGIGLCLGMLRSFRPRCC